MSTSITMTSHRGVKQTIIFITVDLVIFAKFQLSRISREGHFRQFKNLAKINIIIVLLKKKTEIREFYTWKLPKSEIRENLNTRKLLDLQYHNDFTSECIADPYIDYMLANPTYISRPSLSMSHHLFCVKMQTAVTAYLHRKVTWQSYWCLSSH